MKVKVFTAASMNEAMALVKNEMGRDAVILHTRRFRKGGFLGFFSKDMFEVMAGVDTTAPVPEKKNVAATVTPQPVQKDIHADLKNVAIQYELSDMRKMLEQVLYKMPVDDKKVSPILEILLQNDIDNEIAQKLINELPAGAANEEAEETRNILLDIIAAKLERVQKIEIPENGSKIVAFIGPTGVGKTTTIAKLAAHFAIKEGYKVALITADTYRISAVEQLRTYSDIIGVPIEIVYTPEELKQAFALHQDKQIILLDTAGRSPSNAYQLAELQAMLKVNPDIEVQLVLSTTTKYKDAVEIVKKFAVCSPQKILFTKVDESSNIGTIINILCTFPVALSYIATGQSVPDDIELANPKKLADMILRD